IRPIHFKKRAGNIRDAQLVFLQDTPRLGNFFRVQAQNVLVPHAAQFDPVHAVFFCCDFTSPAEVLGNFVVNDRNTKGRLHMVTPIFSSRYFWLISAHSLGVRRLSGTASSSTTAQPRKLTLCKASNTAGRSTRPRPSSTKR